MAETKTDITTSEDIKLLVDSFYKKVLVDETIGYIFTDVTKLDVEYHMPKMYAFWEMTLFHTSDYTGNPMEVHVNLHQKEPLQKAHFDRWIEMFNETVDELFDGQKANLAKTRALSIATVMQIKITN